MFFQDGQRSHRTRERVVLKLLTRTGVYLARTLVCLWRAWEALLEETIVVQRGDRGAPHDGSPRDEFVETSAVGPAHE